MGSTFLEADYLRGCLRRTWGALAAVTLSVALLGCGGGRGESPERCELAPLTVEGLDFESKGISSVAAYIEGSSTSEGARPAYSRLTRMGADDESIIEGALLCLDGEGEAARLLALDVLHLICVDARGTRSMRDKVVTDLAQRVLSGQLRAERTKAACKVLGCFARSGTDSGIDVAGIIMHASAEEGLPLCSGLVDAGLDAGLLLPALVRWTVDGESFERSGALEVIARLGRHGEAARPAIHVALGDEHCDVRSSALRALAALGTLERADVVQVLQMLDRADVTASVQAAATRALREVEDQALSLIWQDMAHAPSHSRIVRLRVLRTRKDASPNALAAVRDLVASDDLWVGLEAARTVWEVTRSQTDLVRIASVIIASEVPPSGVQVVLRSLRGIRVGEDVVGLLGRVVHFSDEYVLEEAARTLTSLEGDIDAVLSMWSTASDSRLRSLAAAAWSHRQSRQR